jgi:23S rRNA (pseudouridine1915-N3)-methyltransferase
MRLTLAAIGAVKHRAFGDACDEYARRIERYAKLAIVEVREARAPLADEVKRRESEALRKAAPERAFRVVLDERGELVTSAGLAQRLEKAALAGRSEWVFFIGGAEGHDDTMRQSADWVWSLTPLTLPHELARVVVLEQIYRAFSILRGEPYHRA